MNDVICKIAKIKKRIHKSSSCDYLYSHFDDLLTELNTLKEGNLPIDVSSELCSLIHVYAEDSIYNTNASANWVRYSARCFYCADYLVHYLEEPSKEKEEGFLNGYFFQLVEACVAPVLQQDVLAKYIQRNINSIPPVELYDNLIRKATRECLRCRLWSASEVSLSLTYNKSIKWLINSYIKAYSDYSMLKIWIPLLNTVRLASMWYEYPDSANYEHLGRYTRVSVKRCLDEMLEIHLALFRLWYWHNSQEILEVLSLEDLIEVLEVYDDDEFEKTLRHMVTLPYNEKIQGVLKHFAEDDEDWIVRLSKELLSQYHL
ncbi:MAG: hypothetical protein J6Y98_09955 [Bacteroidales bacterium]|nr:hypothetical protein [Bacteroidales bacterium]